MAQPTECPQCGATAVDPCQKEPKIDCERDH